MSTTKALHQSVDDLSRQLRLPAFRRHFLPLAQAAAGAGQTHESYLLDLMKVELDERVERRKKQRLRRCGLPYKRYLSELVRAELPQDGQTKIGVRERLDFIGAGQNVILSGNPGTGKTHIAIGLAIQACLEDYNVLFTSVPQLLTQIRESRSQKTQRTLESRFEKYDLVVCDEFGYVSFDKAAAELLFTHLSLRAGRKSTIITTNLGFDRWTEIFGDAVLTAAMVDRITHKAILVDMNGESYRLKETRAQQEALRNSKL
jgi:DNA replication protein DnaC